MDQAVAGEQAGSVWTLMRPVSRRIRWVFFFSGLSTLSSLAAVGVLMLLVASGDAASRQPAWGLLAALAVLVALAFGLRLAAYQVSHLAAFRLENLLRAGLCGKYARLPMGVAQAMGQGTLSKVAFDDVRDLHAFVADTTPIYPRIFIAPLVSLAAMFYLDWRLALAVLLVLVAVVAYLRSVAGRNQALAVRYGSAREEVNTSIVEFIQAMPVVRTFDVGNLSYGRYQQALEAFSTFVARWYGEVASSGNVLMVLLNPLFTLMFVLWLGAWFVFGDTLGAAGWVGFMLMSAVLSETILPLLFLQSTMQKIAQPVQRIHQLLQLPELPAGAAQPEAAAPLDHGIVFDRVGFSYTADAPRVLDGVSCTVPQGHVVALVGPSGAGKSTLARLLLRFWDPVEGRILIGGVDIRNMSAGQLMERVGFVFQDTFLLSGSIADNIRLGSPDASRERVEAAARAAQAHDFIAALPNGYDTSVGERGAFLSGGQKQRITIARAVLQDRPILVLDEATAYADPENAAAIMQALWTLMRGKTVVIVAHRLSSIRHADTILVLRDGRLVESGTHDALLARDGVYNAMWRDYSRAEQWAVRPPSRAAALALPGEHHA